MPRAYKEKGAYKGQNEKKVPQKQKLRQKGPTIHELEEIKPLKNFLQIKKIFPGPTRTLIRPYLDLLRF